jgi:hypothetical protein
VEDYFVIFQCNTAQQGHGGVLDKYSPLAEEGVPRTWIAPFHTITSSNAQHSLHVSLDYAGGQRNTCIKIAHLAFFLDVRIVDRLQRFATSMSSVNIPTR